MLVITVLAILSAATGAAALASSTGTLNAEFPTAGPAQSMTAGMPFQDPPDADTTVTLDATDTGVAPTIRATPGTQVTVRVVNHLPVAVDVHFTDGSLCVAAGATGTYQLTVPTTRPQGTYWYQSRAAGLTCPSEGTAPTAAPTATPITAPPAAPTGALTGALSAPTAGLGDELSGALIVGDDRTLLPAAYQNVTAHTFVLKDAGPGSDAPTIQLVNGQLRPVLTLRPDETQLWRLINAGSDMFYRLRLDGCTFTVVGEDGVPVAAVTTANVLLLPPAKRYDVLVTANSAPSSTWLRTTAYNTGPQGDQYPDAALVKVNVAGAAVPRLPAPTGAVRTAPASLAAVAIVKQRTLDLSESPDGLASFINGKQFDQATSVFPDPARLGTVEEWTILNESGEDHPFTLPATTFQVISANGTALSYTHMQDIVQVPHTANGVPGKVVIRIPIAGHPGRWMFHCAVGGYDDGMMSFLNVVP